MFTHRDEVFVAGGQPTITYVDRASEHIERTFARALATPNQIVSLSGPTKTGKTVLSRKVIDSKQYVWIDGGQVKTGAELWAEVAGELNLACEEVRQETDNTQLGLDAKIPLIATAKGSKLFQVAVSERRIVSNMSAAIEEMLKRRIVLVIDDFHYIDKPVRVELMRNIKGAVFNGLKVLLLSVTHRVFDAIKDESELTGRFTAISLPHWSLDDLRKIPTKGFKALNVSAPDHLLDTLCNEAQENPFLMQKFCWELCFDLGIERQAIGAAHQVPATFDPAEIFKRIANDAGLPIYQKLAAGPQSRKVRAKRPLRAGGQVDIYQAILLALAATGPKAVVPYDELRGALTSTLSDMVPQKHEITAALKHLSKIARDIGAESAIDWDEDKREVNVADPYLRFFLKWQSEGL
ncbi:MAG: hypothetical protein KJZ75_06815 [Hyphomonadaceae bacterium]|nr:hypothetical protein [Hyphomonadaceae bacterium]